MTNKKKILIETLHGSVAQLNELSSMTEGIDIYDDTGCVDTDFFDRSDILRQCLYGRKQHRRSKNILTVST